MIELLIVMPSTNNIGVWVGVTGVAVGRSVVAYPNAWSHSFEVIKIIWNMLRHVDVYYIFCGRSNQRVMPLMEILIQPYFYWQSRHWRFTNHTHGIAKFVLYAHVASQLYWYLVNIRAAGHCFDINNLW